MDIKGKKVLFLGDSITEGVGTEPRSMRYTDVFARISGCEMYNYGISGTRIARKHRASPNPITDQCFLDRVETMNEEADVIVVFGGTNDFGHGDGGLGEFYDTDEYSFYGALHGLIKRLIEKYSESTIIFLTPLHRTSENELINEIGLPRERLAEYAKAIKEVCEYYSIPVLDLYANSGMQPSLKKIKEVFMPDGLHPSNKGASLIANRLYGFISAL